MYKSDLLLINGHDEDYQRASVGEDSDVEWRIRKAAIQIASVKFRAIVYHLYHDSNYSLEDMNFNMNVLREKQRQGNFFVEKGLVKAR